MSFCGHEDHEEFGSSLVQVKVQLFAEAGCPFCRAAIAGPVNQTLSTPSIAAIMDRVGDANATKRIRKVRDIWIWQDRIIQFELGCQFCCF